MDLPELSPADWRPGLEECHDLERGQACREVCERSLPHWFEESSLGDKCGSLLFAVESPIENGCRAGEHCTVYVWHDCLVKTNLVDC